MHYTNQKLQQIFHEIIYQNSIKNSSNVLKKHSATILKLQTEFKNRIHQNKSKHSNFFESKTKEYDLSRKDLTNLLDRIKTQSQELQRQIPNRIKQTDWYPTIFNSLNFDSDQAFDIKEEVFNILKKDPKTSQSMLNKIILKKDVNVPYSTAAFDKPNKKVIIKINSQANSANDLISFAHECGHALDLLKFKGKTNLLKSKSYFEMEERAIQVEYNIAKKVKGVYPSLIGLILQAFRDTYFEYRIYHQNTNNLSRLYAEATNVILGTKINSNPLYIFNDFLLEWPCYSATYTVIYLKLLEKKLTNLPTNPTKQD